MIRRFFILFLLIAPFVFIAQKNTDRKLDSLYEELKKKQADSVYIKLYFKIGLRFEKLDEPDSAFKYLRRSNELAKQSGINRLYMYASEELGKYFVLNDEADSALAYLRNSLEFAENKNDPKYAEALGYLGNAYLLKGDYVAAYEYFLKHLKNLEKTGSGVKIARAYANVAVSLKEQKKYNDALLFFEKALKINDTIKDHHDLYILYLNIGTVYEELSKKGTSKYNTNKALENYYKAKDLMMANKEDINPGHLTVLLGNIGNIYADMEQYDKSIAEYNQALAYMDSLDNFTYTPLIYNNLAGIYIDMNKLKEAAKYLKLGYEATLKSASPDNFLNNYKAFARYYEKSGDFEKAYRYQIRVKELSDSLFSTDNAEKRKAIEMNAEFAQKEAEAKALQDKKEVIAKEERQRQRVILYAFIFGFILMILVAFQFYRSFRIKQKSNEIITMQKQEVEKQKELVEEKQREILDSIRYAKRIQGAHLPSDEYIDKNISRLKKG